MDIEELSKAQIILLVLLVSFVTSIATGIVTVSLVNQAPPEIAQTVNRVLEQTIQEVAPSGQNAAAATVTKTVIVQGTSVAGAVQKALPSVVRLYSADGATFFGMGVVLNSSGMTVTDTAAIDGVNHVLIQTQSGEQVLADVSTRDTGTGLAFLSIATSTEATSTPAWTPIAIEASKPQLGEALVLLAGQNTPWVGDGLISSLPAATQDLPALVKTNVSGDNVLYGSPVIDATGDLVGISTEVSRSISASTFMPVSAIEADSSGSASK